MTRQDNDRFWKDLSGKLFGNTNRTDFYEEVGKLVKDLQSLSHLASYEDLASVSVVRVIGTNGWVN